MCELWAGRMECVSCGCVEDGVCVSCGCVEDVCELWAWRMSVCVAEN